MIEAVYDRDKLCLTVTGHAGSDEKGKDLVCAAVSALVYTLAENVCRMCADKTRVRRPVVELSEGNAKIACAPVHGMQAVTALVFDSVCAGFDVLAAQYPQYIHYKVLG